MLVIAIGPPYPSKARYGGLTTPVVYPVPDLL